MPHQKIKRVLPLIAVLLSLPGYADDNNTNSPTMMIEKSVIINEAQKQMRASADYQSSIKAALTFLDVNHDRYISDREFSQFIEGIVQSPDLSPTDKQIRRQKLEAIFNAADTSNQKKISQETLENIWPQIEQQILEDIFTQKDRNHNNYYDEQDWPTPEESLQQLQQSREQIQQLQAKLDSMDTKAMADAMLQNAILQQAEEDFYQMDKDKNNCIDKEEYATYQIAQDQAYVEAEEDFDDGFSLTKEDYEEIYDIITKANPSCLSHDEYINDIKASASEGISELDDDFALSSEAETNDFSLPPKNDKLPQ